MRGSLALSFLTVLLLLSLVTGCDNQPQAFEPSTFEPSNGKLGNYLSLDTFRHQFNEVSHLDIGKFRLLKNDLIITSYLYSFNRDLALSVLKDNQSDSVIEVILITTLDSENKSFMDSLIYGCDPELTLKERSEIITDLIKSPHFQKDKDFSITKNQIIYRLQELGSYVKLTAEQVMQEQS